jgi:hypothetical protein
MLLDGGAVQSTFNAHNSQTVWAYVGHSEFDLSDTFVSASLRRPGDNASMETTESGVKTATGDSGTAHGSMMEVEEETSVTDSSANLQSESTHGIEPTPIQDMEEQEAVLGLQEFDLPGTSVSASLCWLGHNAGMETKESAVKTATGDSGTANDSMMEVEEETPVTDLGFNLQLQSEATVGIDYTSTQDMEEEEEQMTAIQGAQVPQAPTTPACDATTFDRGHQSQIQIQACSCSPRHRLDSLAARGIVTVVDSGMLMMTTCPGLVLTCSGFNRLRHR